MQKCIQLDLLFEANWDVGCNGFFGKKVLSEVFGSVVDKMADFFGMTGEFTFLQHLKFG